tara:strand:- start:286 stop:408 length:123 start_codon:yes stop_codon:yes gene_type:complete
MNLKQLSWSVSPPSLVVLKRGKKGNAAAVAVAAVAAALAR